MSPEEEIERLNQTEIGREIISEVLRVVRENNYTRDDYYNKIHDQILPETNTEVKIVILKMHAVVTLVEAGLVIVDNGFVREA